MNSSLLIPVLPGQFVRFNGISYQVVRIRRRFSIGQRPVLVREYMQFAEATGFSLEFRIEVWDANWKLGPSFVEANPDPAAPVVGVSYDDALLFLAWASLRDMVNYRLPTEAELEFCMRNGVQEEPDYDSTGLICSHAHEVANKREAESLAAGGSLNQLTTLAAMQSQSIEQLHGSIWQWCSDWFAPYAVVAEVVDPIGPMIQPQMSIWRGQEMPAGHVIRGGSFSYPPEYASCTHRHFSFEEDRNFNLGFRVCL